MDDRKGDFEGQSTHYVETVDSEEALTARPASKNRGAAEAGADMLGRVVGNIRLEAVLGQGGMGTVFRGVDEKLGRTVAVKSIRSGTILDAEARARFLREAQVLSRLNHSNICQVYDFVEGDRDDYLILEFVEGTVLSDTIRAGVPRQLGFRIALQLADVLTVTHSRGIVHRDLKPDNVMLTGDEHVKVLDFGLARQEQHKVPIASGGSAAPIGDGQVSSSADTVKTVLGTVMGTIGYMSPEQARGEPASPPSDIYSLGLVLQEVFTGNKPFNTRSTVHQVLMATRVGESPAAQGLASDLAQLIESMKTLEPADRPTAPEVARRLRRIIDKPRRRLRWAAVALVVAAILGGSTKYVVDLNRERTAALEARSDALSARDDAEELMGFILDDLHAGLQPLGRLDLLSQVANKALDYYTAENLGGAMTDEGLLRRSLALRNLGGVFEDQGALDEAANAYRASLEVSRTVAGREPENLDAVMAMARARIGLASLSLLRDEPDAALASYAEAVENLQTLVDTGPANAESMRRLADTLADEARVLFTVGRGDEALGELERAISITRSLVEGAPGDAELQLDLGTRYRFLSQLLAFRGDLAGARQASDDDLAICTAVARADNTNSNARLALVEAHTWRGQLLREEGDLDASAEAMEQAVRIGERLAADDPTNTYRRFRLSATHDALGEVRFAAGDLGGAREAFDEALALMQEVAAVDASNEVFLNDLAYSYLQVGRAEAALGRPAAAREAWREGARVVAPIADEDGLPPIQETYARALLLLGRVEEARPVVRRVIEAGWPLDEATAALCRQHGIVLP